MSDGVAVMVGLMACFVPLGMLVAWVVYIARVSGLTQRVQELEAEVARLGGEQLQTTRYLQSLHARLEADALTTPAEPVEQFAAATEELEETAAQAQIATPTDAPAETKPPLESDSGEPVPETRAPVQTTRQAPDEAQASPAPSADAPVESTAPVESMAPVESTLESTPPLDPQPEDAPNRATPSKPSMGLEQWIGVRGAAAAGAILLVLSALYFFQYSIEHGFVTPAMRILIGAVLGLGCLLAGELRLRKTHITLANWLDGAGIAILYITIWAGRSLYELYPHWAASLGMLAITGTCVALSSRRRSTVIAALGLFGGFITPLALSTGTDRPIPLFGYLLLLDIAMLTLARARRWSWLALLSLGGTFLYQFAWLSFRLDEERLVLGVGISLVFALVFSAWPRPRAREQSETPGLGWQLMRTAGLVLPMLFAFILAVRSDLGAHFWPTAVQLGVLALAGSVLSARQKNPLTGITIACSTAAVLLGWAVAHPLVNQALMARWVGLVAALGVLMHIAGELDRSELGAARMVASVAHAAFAVLMAIVTITNASDSPWPQLAFFGLATLLAARAAAFPRSRQLPVAVGGLGAFALGSAFVVNVGESWSTSPTLLASLWVALAALTQVGGVWPRARRLRHASDHAAVVIAAFFIIILPSAEGVLGVAPVYASTLALVVLGLLAATRLRKGLWMAPILGAALLGHFNDLQVHTSSSTATLQLAGMMLSVALFSVWPLLLGRRRDANHFRVASLAAPLYFLLMRSAWLRAFGPEAQGLLPVGLAVVSLGLAVLARRSLRDESTLDDRATNRSGLIWSLVAATSFLTVAIPLQLENEWITIGWSLEALALLLLFRRFRHAGLKYLAVALASAVFIRLVFNPYLLEYHLRGSLRVLNWLSYTYLVPVVCLFGMWRVLAKSEIPLRQSWEHPIFPKRVAVLAALMASAGIVVLFAWVNLTIFDVFAPARELTIPLDRMPARDLSLSLSWAVFALGMLAVGLWRRSMPLRVASLLLILLTAGKTFLYDLGHLSDLYRVASLAGLAVSLIVISLVYQRFVFRTEKTEEESA
ncbi:MAG: DUF2339 domain-containing protein [Deltaproteobacteria bacterium]|nr:DUF2339 domain-containing protein [Deltaproteobacteria bacterium]